MTAVDFPIFDADNHYYEATDAFTRHMDPKLAKRGVQWAEIGGRTRLLVGGRICRFIPNPTFDPVTKPGALDAYFRGKNPAGTGVRELFGELEPIRPEYRDRDARLAVMDGQGLDGSFMFPTLGVGMEEALLPDVDALYASFHAFNRWVDDDWGYAYRDRIFAAPMISLVDETRAEAELAEVLGRGARLVCLRAGPIMHPSGGRSPGDGRYDRFWSMVEEAGITVAYHSGDSGYERYADDWGVGGEFEAFRLDPFRTIIMTDRPILETMAALVVHGVFDRHPGVRVATIESGSGWVGDLFKRFKKLYGQVPQAFPGGDPRQDFGRHVWVAPFYEDDIRRLADSIGVDHVLMGSDWPHAEGLAEPRDFIDELHGFDAGEARRVMHDNARGLVGAAAPA